MRIFIALDIPADIRARMLEYGERARSLAPEARWARPEGLHVTLKFIGEVTDAKVQEIKTALAAVRGSPFELNFANVGFFPSPKSPRVFWIGVEGGPPLPQLTAAIDNATQKLGIAKEERAYNPHLTLARAGLGPAGHHLLRPVASVVQSEPAPQFGTMTAREFFLYQSQPQRGGSKYTKLQRFGLE
ncbi:MAG TPA: RNA 2',3'-cyclic phosphodiesterase [Candidatus Angelobacter sp.]